MNVNKELTRSRYPISQMSSRISLLTVSRNWKMEKGEMGNCEMNSVLNFGGKMPRSLKRSGTLRLTSFFFFNKKLYYAQRGGYFIRL